MSTNLSELDPNSPEYDAAVEAALREEDAEHGAATAAADDATDTTETTADPEAVTPAVVEAKTEPDAQPKVAGVASKDGTRVLPYAALQAERRSASAATRRAERAEREAADVRAELAELKAGKRPDDEPDAAELEAHRVDYPEVDKLLKKTERLEREAKELRARVPARVEQDDDESPEAVAQRATLEAIDEVPMLAGWKADDREKFVRAIEIDNGLKNSPKWKGKPLAERFAHVTRQVADEFDIALEDKPVDTASTNTKPTSARTAPAKVIEAATRTAPNTLSDFKGGAADPSRDNIDRMPAQQMLGRAAQMSDEEIDKWLAKVG